MPSPHDQEAEFSPDSSPHSSPLRLPLATPTALGAASRAISQEARFGMSEPQEDSEDYLVGPSPSPLVDYPFSPADRHTFATPATRSSDGPKGIFARRPPATPPNTPLDPQTPTVLPAPHDPLPLPEFTKSRHWLKDRLKHTGIKRRELPSPLAPRRQLPPSSLHSSFSSPIMIDTPYRDSPSASEVETSDPIVADFGTLALSDEDTSSGENDIFGNNYIDGPGTRRTSLSTRSGSTSFEDIGVWFKNRHSRESSANSVTGDDQSRSATREEGTPVAESSAGHSFDWKTASPPAAVWDRVEDKGLLPLKYGKPASRELWGRRGESSPFLDFYTDEEREKISRHGGRS